MLGGRIDKDGNIASVFVPDDADLIILQRPTHKWLSQAVPLIREKGVAVVVDMDDDLAHVHPANSAFHFMHPKYGDPQHTWHNAADACRNASMVTVSTHALLDRYARHGRGEILPNFVPQRFLDIERVDNDTFTWCGVLHSHPNDLQELGGAVAIVSRDYPFKIIGVKDGIDRVLGVKDIDATGAIEFGKWAEGVATSGVTMAPLADTKFNAAKSWLKPLEAMAVGVPVLVSPRIEYQRLAVLTGVGTVVERPRLWERALRLALREPEWRADQSLRGREVVRKSFTIEDNAWRWDEAWQRAVELERGLVKA